MKKINKIKSILLDKTFKYDTSTRQIIPIDENNHPLINYISYVSLNSMHDILNKIGRDSSVVIVDGESFDYDEKSVEVEVQSSFYVISVSTMQKIVSIIDEIKKENITEEEITKEDFEEKCKDCDNKEFNLRA